MFISVAERLRAGDRLYVDVYENKDPLFHYTLALGRSITPLAGWFIEVGWIVVAAISVFSICRRLALNVRMSTFIAFVASPVIITGAFYSPGGSHLPGIALTLAVIACVVRGRPFVAGLLLAVLACFKLVMLPVAIVAVAVLLIFGRDRRGALRVSLGTVASLALIALLMVARGELLPYLNSLRSSASYAQDATSQPGVGAVISHITRVFTVNTQVSLLTMAVVLLLVLGHRRAQANRALDPIGSHLTRAVIAATVAAVAVLAVTGLWVSHAQVFVALSTISLALLASRGPRYLSRAGGMNVGALLGFAVLLAGIPSMASYVTPIEYARGIISSQLGDPPESIFIRSSGAPTTYARVGKGNDAGHAQGLQDWTLACPYFGQSDLDPKSLLDSTLNCLPSANVILFAAEALPLPGVPAWNEYLEDVQALLERDYRCVAGAPGRICTKKNPVAASQ
jgi:hypothetical protein